MGYYSNFEISIANTPEDVSHAEILSRLKAISGIDFSYYVADSVKWYDHEDHLEILSKVYPECYFEVEALGEDGERWRVYAHQGEVETVKAVIVWPKPRNRNIIP